jgi:hypothetical protein
MNWIFNLLEPEGDRDGAKNKEAMVRLGEQVPEYVNLAGFAPAAARFVG